MLTPLRHLSLPAVVLVVGLLASSDPLAAQVAEGISHDEDDFFVVSDPVTPRVAYAINRDADGLKVVIETASFQAEGKDVSVSVGLSAGRTITLETKNATVSHHEGLVDFAFTVPSSQLVNQPDDWKKLHFGFAVAWSGGPFGQDRLRERFLHVAGAPSDGLSVDSSDWAPFDLEEHAASMVGLKNRIFVDFNQPMDGKATVVIENDKGERVRNLISGQAMPKGPQRIEWNGLDDQGNIVPPSTYHWRAISHPGITPHYLFSFYNHGNPPWRSGSPGSNWLADHSDAVAAASSGDRVYLGAPVAESGQNIVQLNLQGDETGHLTFPTLVGVGKLFLAADDQNFYAIMEGRPEYEPYVEGPNGTWQIRRPLNILRYDMQCQPVKYDGVRGEKVITDNMYQGSGLHTKNMHVPNANNLAGAALLNGVIYISLKQEDRVVMVDASSGATTGEIKVKDPGVIAANGKDVLIVFSGKDLLKIDPVTKTTSPLFTPALSVRPDVGDAEQPLIGFTGINPTGMALSASNEIFLSDNGTDQDIKVYSLDGKLLREIGMKGGRPINGAWNGNGVYQPHGIAVDKEGKLWVAETNTYPRRISVWDTNTGKLITDYFGPAHYGAPEGSFDSADHTRWIGGGEQWKLDFDKKTATPVATLYHQTKPGQLQTRLMGHYWNFYHDKGRTFLIGYGDGQSIYEIRPDGSAKLWAFCGTLSSIAQEPRWTLPKSITDVPALQSLFQANAAKLNPPASLDLTPFGSWNDKVKFDERLLRNVSVLWVDKNGDDLAQPDEFEMLAPGDRIAGDWGYGNPTLDLNVPANVGGKAVILKLKPDGFLPSGAPNYSLAKALASPVVVDPAAFSNGEQTDAIQDHFGRELVNSSPMRGIAPDGHTEWTFPNDWIGVHGSHEAPLPQPGIMQGALYFLGTAPLDSKSDVVVMNGNHGRFFVLTTDGFYLDEMFKDVRVTQIADAYLIGGECFGGFFSKAEDGNYYLQSGHTDYRVFQISGLDQLVRTEGTVSVSSAQALAAQANNLREASTKLQPKFMTVTELSSGAKLPALPSAWPGDWNVTWGKVQQPYPYVQVKAVRLNDRLYLGYHVKDPSPWVNHGSDWTQLFKTGDCVDFQFSTDPQAKPNRAEPVPGDKRLLIAPFKDSSIAVLYTYKQPGAKAPMGFSSPSQTVRVDVVQQLASAQIKMVPGDGSYDLVVSVPLADLGLSAAGEEADLRGDFGVIYGDSAGSMDLLRSYWSNQATGLVNDVPGEVMIAPKLWGTLKFNPEPTP